VTVAVKICGLKTEAALDAALDGGAEYIGLVFFPKSPRHLDIATARRLADRARGRARIVALLVDPGDAALEDVLMGVSPDLLQLHGNETPARVRDIARRFGRPLVKAVKVETREDAERAQDYAALVEFVLFDAKPPAVPDTLPGGNGVSFDWTLLDGVTDKTRFMLSGGLTPENVAEAIRFTGAPAVDVSSGVEIRPGEKDPERIRRFIRAAKSVNEAA